MDGLVMKYFVLKPKGQHAHAIASRVAMKEYATVIRETNAELADNIMSWVDRESPKATLKDQGTK